MLNYLKTIFQPKHNTLNRIEISSENILHNLKIIKSLQPNSTIIPVLKANAYGHGIEQICTILSKEPSVKMVAVDSYPEYLKVLKHSNFKVLLIGEISLDVYKKLNTQRTEIAIYNQSTLQHLIKLQKKFSIHIFLNTGMNREGVNENTIDQFCKTLNNQKKIKVTGVMSHLANADSDDHITNQQQIDSFKNLYSIIHSYGHTPHYIHISNSAGCAKIHDPLFNTVRSGIAMYGYNPLSENDPYYPKYSELKPALDIYSTVVGLQTVGINQGASYNKTRKSTQPTSIGTIAFGYYEGLTRSASNHIEFIRKSTPIKQVGNICMNLTSFDTNNLPIHVGDEIKVISKNKNDTNTIEQLAKQSNTIHYEILVKINEKIRRIIL